MLALLCSCCASVATVASLAFICYDSVVSLRFVLLCSAAVFGTAVPIMILGKGINIQNADRISQQHRVDAEINFYVYVVSAAVAVVFARIVIVTIPLSLCS